MRARAAGDAAVLLDLAAESADATGVAGRLAAAIRAARLPGVVDVVPGACTVLVRVAPGSWQPGQLADRLLQVRAPAADADAGPPVLEIPVCYDGPDLAAVAALTSLPAREVVARHQAAEYRVGWLGFSPGFGYLTGLDPALAQVPRLDSPRVSVPGGSVAIAGGLAAVYPASSPGGWRLLGRTNARLWDAARQPPALLAPGARVRFRAVSQLSGDRDAGDSDRAVSAPPAAGQPAVQVLQPGPLATIQDLGRPGLGHLGVPRSGAADTDSLLLANALVGNEPAAACVEITLGRAALRPDRPVIAAITGAPAPARLEIPGGTVLDVPHGRGFAVPPGAVLRLGSPATGLRSYLAFGGGIAAEATLGSRSADLLSGLGPPPLRAGEVLPIGPARGSQADSATTSAYGPGGQAPAGSDVVLAVIPGPRHDWFAADALDTLAAGRYQVTPASNRTGLRLAGPALRRARPAELPSEGVVTGSLQVSHDGQLILLLADHPTTGGYPVIAVVRRADVSRAGQLRPGQLVRFSIRP